MQYERPIPNDFQPLLIDCWLNDDLYVIYPQSFGFIDRYNYGYWKPYTDRTDALRREELRKVVWRAMEAERINREYINGYWPLPCEMVLR